MVLVQEGDHIVAKLIDFGYVKYLPPRDFI
jgi:hypothetical protein